MKTPLISNLHASRRGVLQASGAGFAALASLSVPRGLTAQTPESATLLERLVIDLSGVPESIDPALAYSARDWSIVHSIYDSPLALSETGDIVPLAAESFAFVDDVTLDIMLRSEMTFHDGTPVTSSAISRSLAHILASGSEAAGLFSVIETVEEVDALTARLTTNGPAPWLPAQIAVWMVLLPEGFDAGQALSNPVGTGPYMFTGQEPGGSISLARNPNYPDDMAKGAPIADRVVFRFVPETSTRIADLAAGQAQIVTEIPHDQMAAISGRGNVAIEDPIVASQWIRIATDVPPFDRVEVRQALNHAIDVESVAQALMSPVSQRLASLFPDERSIAFNPDLEPYVYDPDKARQLLASAGVDRLSVELEMTSAARVDVAEAIVGQLAVIGFDASIVVSEYATFNANWADPAAPPLRLVSWVPLYEPQTLLGLVFSSQGFLARYRNAEVDALIAAGSVETDPETRKAIYADLAQVMHDDAPAVFLWNLTAGYGVAPEAADWTPRGDGYVLPMERSGSAE